MKGFKKNGKFRPTEKKSKSSLKKSDLKKRSKESFCKACGSRMSDSECRTCKAMKRIEQTDEFKGGMKHGDVADKYREQGKSHELGLRQKQSLELGKDFHLYRVWSFDDNDRHEIAHIKAKDIEQATDYVKKEYITPEGQKEVEEDGDGQDSYLTLYDSGEEEIREEVEREAENIEFETDNEKSKWIDDEVEERMEDNESGYSYGYQIEENDEVEEDFKTIFGGNDFVDLIEPERSGEPTSHVVGKMEAMQALGKALEKQSKENIKKHEEKGTVPRSKETLDASELSQKLSHHFGSGDIDSKDSRFIIHFGEHQYAGVTNEKIESFERKYPNAKLDINPKERTITVNGLKD